ncbi:MAG: hypothetical protein KBC66_01895 [Kiritimatiellae bacterium]|nr:hypothetical protein [Kiritimatiellia bacterium]
MIRREVSKITCIVDVRLTARIEAEADRMGLLETFSERGKQIALQVRPFWQPLGRHYLMMEAPADILRLYVPRQHERAAMARLATATDLFLPGRGSVFAEDVQLAGKEHRLWDETRLAKAPAWAADGHLPPAPYDLVFCIVQRGRGSELARTMLEMGLGVPIVSYGEGMGMRDRLGLLRITIPQEKEILWFLVPPGDSDFVMDVAMRKADLHEPGSGFLGRTAVRALAVNSRLHLDRRRHVASMEQIISTLDQLHGSTNWRRMTPAARSRPGADDRGDNGMTRFTLMCEEGAAAGPVRAAMDAGAGGATLSRLSLRAPETPGVEPEAEDEEVAMESHARECCDLFIPQRLVKQIEDAVVPSGLFDEPAAGFIEIGTLRDSRA